MVIVGTFLYVIGCYVGFCLYIYDWNVVYVFVFPEHNERY